MDMNNTQRITVKHRYFDGYGWKEETLEGIMTPSKWREGYGMFTIDGGGGMDVYLEADGVTWRHGR